MNGTAAIYSPSPATGRLHQGEIVSNVVQVRVSLESLRAGGDPALERIIHPLAIVVTQDCELEQDFNVREKKGAESLPNILFCEVIEATRLRTGPPHLPSESWRRVTSNQNERYHFLQGVLPGQDMRGDGLAELGIDFKRYFTIPTSEVYLRLTSEIQRRCLMKSPYLEHFSDRFSHYLARVALPVEHQSAPAQQISN